MSTFFLFGRYSPDAVTGISAHRTQQARELIEKLGGQVKVIYALLGEYDLVLIVDLPAMAVAMQAAIELRRLTGISFSTSAAIPIEEFDQMLEKP
jgi:uncharacterized protein with GYD domain